MRPPLDATRVRALLSALGRHARGPGRVYLTGGTSAVLEGWRTSTVHADLELDPEPAGVFDAIRTVKDHLAVHIRLAAPDRFLPALPGWRVRSRWIAREGEVGFFHDDVTSQLLAKLARGLHRDLPDARAMVARGLVDPTTLVPSSIGSGPTSCASQRSIRTCCASG